ncbi:MAG TPA: TonB-dependent receptor [Bacteroidetes bacterium]|nr:TonB-dependent receptor [Bacteroidota bacterium]
MIKFGSVLLIVAIVPMLLYAEIEGQILSAKSEEPIRYALVRTERTDLVTISDDKGYFSLPINEIPCKIFISSQGYELREFTVTKPKNNLIYLSIDPIRIQGLRVSTEKATDLKLSSTDIEILNHDNVELKSTTALIASHPGLLIKEGANGEKQLQLHAYEARHSVYLINGMKTDNSMGNSVSSIPVDMIDHVEVICHNAGSTSGESAIGGIVNIVLKNSRTHLHTHEFSSRAGSWQNYSLNYQNNLSFGTSSILCNLYGHTAQNDFSYYNEYDKETILRTNNDIKEGSISLQSRIAFQNDVYSKLSILFYAAERGIPGQSNDYVWFEKSRGKAHRFYINTDVRFPFGKNIFSVDLYCQFNRSHYENTSENPFYSENSTNRTSTFEARAKLNSNGSTVSSISQCGLRYETYKYDDHLHPESSILQKNRTFIYLSNETSIPLLIGLQKLSLIPSVRADYFVDEDVYVSSHLTLEYPAKLDVFQMSISGGNSYAMPESSSLFWKGDSQVQGNPDLEPERSYGVSSNAKVKFGSFTFSGEAYFNRIENLIYWYRSALGLWKPDNLADAELYGFSGSLNWYIFDNLEIELIGSRNYPINKTSSADHYNKYLTNKSLHKIQGKIKYSIADISLFASVLNIGKQFDNFSNTVLIDGYTTYDAGLHQTSQIGKKIKTSIIFRINNIFNIQYETSRNIPSPGRNYEVSCSLHFL